MAFATIELGPEAVTPELSAMWSVMLTSDYREVERGWDSVRERGVKAGIVWADVAFSRIELRLRRERGVESGDIDLIFRYHAVEYRVVLRRCVKSPRGWLLIGAMKWTSVVAASLSPDELVDGLPPTCAKFVEAYARCVDGMPPGARVTGEEELRMLREVWSKDPVDGMESQCRQALNAARTHKGGPCPAELWR